MSGLLGYHLSAALGITCPNPQKKSKLPSHTGLNKGFIQAADSIYAISKSYIPRALKYVGYTLRASARKVYPTYFKAQGI